MFWQKYEVFYTEFFLYIIQKFNPTIFNINRE